MAGKRKQAAASQAGLPFPVVDDPGATAAVAGPKVWTIGHSNHSLEHFLSLLRSQTIDLLVDVRRFPASRAHPHFNQEALAEALAREKIDYRHVPELGGRRRPRPDSPHQAWRNESFRGYADYMDTPEFDAAAAQIFDAAQHHRLALMCSEAVWWRCHRAMIADYLKAQGCEVIHILSATSAAPHPYTSVAKIVEGRLTY
jgi:uncharacterized protein (DUF488 family)